MTNTTNPTKQSSSNPSQTPTTNQDGSYSHPYKTVCLQKGRKVNPIRDDINDDGGEPQIHLFSAEDAYGKYDIHRYYFTFELPIANQQVFIRSRASGNQFLRLPSRSQIYNAEGIFGDTADLYIAKGQQNNALTILDPDTMADMLELLKTCDIEIYGRTVYIVYGGFKENDPIMTEVKKLAQEMYRDAQRRQDKSKPLPDAHLVENPLKYSITTAGGTSPGRIAQLVAIIAIGFVLGFFLRKYFDRSTSKLILQIVGIIFGITIIIIGERLVRRRRNKLDRAIKQDFSDK